MLETIDTINSHKQRFQSDLKKLENSEIDFNSFREVGLTILDVILENKDAYINNCQTYQQDLQKLRLKNNEDSEKIANLKKEQRKIEQEYQDLIKQALEIFQQCRSALNNYIESKNNQTINRFSTGEVPKVDDTTNVDRSYELLVEQEKAAENRWIDLDKNTSAEFKTAIQQFNRIQIEIDTLNERMATENEATLTKEFIDHQLKLLSQIKEYEATVLQFAYAITIVVDTEPEADLNQPVEESSSDKEDISVENLATGLEFLINLDDSADIDSLTEAETESDIESDDDDELEYETEVQIIDENFDIGLPESTAKGSATFNTLSEHDQRKIMDHFNEKNLNIATQFWNYMDENAQISLATNLDLELKKTPEKSTSITPERPDSFQNNKENINNWAKYAVWYAQTEFQKRHFDFNFEGTINMPTAERALNVGWNIRSKNRQFDNYNKLATKEFMIINTSGWLFTKQATVGFWFYTVLVDENFHGLGSNRKQYFKAVLAEISELLE